MARWSAALAAVLLAAMAALHGSGTGWITRTVQATDAAPFIKSIFPVLFVHPSLQLAVLALVSVWTALQPAGKAPLRLLAAALVATDAGLAVYLGAWLPAGLLAAAATALAATPLYALVRPSA